MLRLFFDLVCPEDQGQQTEFVLTHPDYGIQNVMVSEDGRLLALIDWDGASVADNDLYGALMVNIFAHE
ncbi:predicted protein [Histoplasma mississippiense (nom. inval.)]|uniref:predicted protein n=1 Tax=Ajellomyces capsulatus (strain NAm1 / WU24) TaxID=2059318 RepID=UPI000157D202|nr:predicted protein [Histoplasma mississippiense (nom. inval.)]EDN04842.1 predicted protein [Histoplasma mississippiense (nom. inval.)]